MCVIVNEDKTARHKRWETFWIHFSTSNPGGTRVGELGPFGLGLGLGAAGAVWCLHNVDTNNYSYIDTYTLHINNQK